MGCAFTDADLLDRLEAMDDTVMDTLPFGVVAFTPDGIVCRYNLEESRRAGLTPANVIGRNFFRAVAPCMNNSLVADRFESQPELDTTLDYVFTFRLKPVAVTIRMLKQSGRRRMYLVVDLRKPS